MNKAILVLVAQFGLGCFCAIAEATDIGRSIVYLECIHDGEVRPVRGSGVVVTDRGDVLTAKHVAPQGSICKGSIGVADPDNVNRMIVQPRELAVDAAILRFSNPSLPYTPVNICRLEDWMVRQKIYVAGFPGGTETGAASFRDGILSTVLPNAKGILETDGQTVSGMSGGPVLNESMNGLLGLVIGAQFNRMGVVEHWGILPIAEFVTLLGLDEPENLCYRSSRTHDFTQDDGSWAATWETGKPAVRLGVSVNQGVCYVTGIFGEMNQPDDFVRIEVREGEFVLLGCGVEFSILSYRCGG